MEKFCNQFIRGEITIEKLKKEFQEIKSIIINMEVQHLRSFKSEDPILREKNKKFHKNYRKTIIEYKEGLGKIEKIFADRRRNPVHIHDGLLIAARADERFVRIKKRMEEKRTEEKTMGDFFKAKSKENAVKELAQSLRARAQTQIHLTANPANNPLTPRDLAGRTAGTFSKTTKDLDPSEWPSSRTTRDLDVSEWPSGRSTKELSPVSKSTAELSSGEKPLGASISEKVQSKLTKKTYVAPVMFQPKETASAQRFQQRQAFMSLSKMAHNVTSPVESGPSPQAEAEKEESPTVMVSGESPRRNMVQSMPSAAPSPGGLELLRNIKLSVKCRKLLINKDKFDELIKEMKMMLSLAPDENDVRNMIGSLQKIKMVISREINVLNERAVPPDGAEDIKKVKNILLDILLGFKNSLSSMALAVGEKNLDKFNSIREEFELLFRNMDDYSKFRREVERNYI